MLEVRMIPTPRQDRLCLSKHTALSHVRRWSSKQGIICTKKLLFPNRITTFPWIPRFRKGLETGWSLYNSSVCFLDSIKQKLFLGCLLLAVAQGHVLVFIAIVS
ncbi:hypothetical protein V2J09_024292 [Rumex salicifolius]